MQKILLIDGHSILNRAFFGIPDLTNAEGLHTNAVYGFLNILFKTMEEEQPDCMAVTFDVHAPTFRHQMFDDYKGTRSPMASELREQVPVMKDVLDAMGIFRIERAGLEADDLLGTISRVCEEEGMAVTILSGDRDTLQLATDRIKIRIPKTKAGKTVVEDYFASDVREAYGVSPAEFIDVKALMGDTADNIPGVPGIGEKTAMSLIRQYGSIEAVYEDRANVKPPRASKNIELYWEQAKLSKDLATIRKFEELEFMPADTKIGDLYTKEAYEWFVRLEFKQMLARFDESMGKEEMPAYTVISTESDMERFVKTLDLTKPVSIAIEKNKEELPLLQAMSDIDAVAVCQDKKVVYISAKGELSEKQLLLLLERLAGEASCVSVCHLKEALAYITGLVPERAFDPIIAAYLLNPLKNDYTYTDIASERLGMMVGSDGAAEENTVLAAYVADAARSILKEELEKQDMLSLFETIEMPLVFTLFSMERAGIRVRSDELSEYGKQLGEKIELLEQDIYDLAGEQFNINSPKQLGIILFEKLHMPYMKKTKTGYSTAADVLEKLAPSYPIVDKILEYRQLAKLKSTYADGLAAYICEDGRIHGTFNQTITATGRISSTDPNLQNIPVRMELGRMIRKVFVPDDGYVFLDADYSQIELRILAHCSGDEKLIEAYRQSKDIHRITASQVFHVPFDEVTGLQRRNAKAVNFGIVYGISSFGLSQDLSISRKEAAEYIENYFRTYPGVKRFLDDCVEGAKENGFVQTLYGRRRPVPELKSGNFMQRSFGERVAMNAPIQGTAADIMKIAMIGVERRLRERGMASRLILQVHDELLIETKKEELSIVSEILEREMTEAVSLLVPLIVDIHSGNNWYEAK